MDPDAYRPYAISHIPRSNACTLVDITVCEESVYKLPGVTSQNKVIFIVATIRTSYLTFSLYSVSTELNRRQHLLIIVQQQPPSGTVP